MQLKMKELELEFAREKEPLFLVDQNGYKKWVYSENNSKYIFQKH
jgi:hypothetical protein